MRPPPRVPRGSCLASPERGAGSRTRTLESCGCHRLYRTCVCVCAHFRAVWSHISSRHHHHHDQRQTLLCRTLLGLHISPSAHKHGSVLTLQIVCFETYTTGITQGITFNTGFLLLIVIPWRAVRAVVCLHSSFPGTAEWSFPWYGRIRLPTLRLRKDI